MLNKSTVGAEESPQDLLRKAILGPFLDDDENVLEEAIAKGADVNYLDEDGATPLLLAIPNTYWRDVKSLLLHGADVERVNALGMTPVLLAIYEGRCRILRFLVEAGASLKTETPSHQTALMIRLIWGENDACDICFVSGLMWMYKMTRV